jgi:UDP-3-O-[3-hydroxymyristoyl] glucosamine N-acyltransferase
VVAETAAIDPSAEIGAFAHVGARAIIGARCRIGPGAVIGSGVVLGPDCRVGPNASISHAVLGARVYVYPGARIGQEGFGFSITPGGFRTTPQAPVSTIRCRSPTGSASVATARLRHLPAFQDPPRSATSS